MLSRSAREILIVALANAKIGKEVADAIDASGSGIAGAVAPIVYNLLTQTISINFASTLSSGAISASDYINFYNKEPAIATGLSSQYFRGDKTWQTLDKNAVGLSNVQNLDQTNPANIVQTSSYRFVTDTEKGVWNGKQDALGFTPENSLNKGLANGYAPLDGTTKISSVYLPSYVDDVLEYANLAAFPPTGSSGIIYVAIDTNKVYRWSGSTYIEISPSPGSTDAVPEGVINQYFTPARAQSAITGGASSIVTSNLTASRVLVSDASGKVAANSVTATTLSYLDATSSIQTQLNGKFNNPTGDTTQYIAGDGSLITFPTTGAADRLVTTVYNSTGATVSKMSVIYLDGPQGNLPKLVLAQADSELNSSLTYGIIQNDIGDMSSGICVEAGRLENLNTNIALWAEGDVLYLSPTTPGGITNVKPTAPNQLVLVGVLVRKHPTQGVIQVQIQNGYELEELHDVAITLPPSNDQVLQYESSTSLWKNKTLPTANVSQTGLLSSTDWSTFYGKQSAITGAASTITSSNLTASRVLVSDASGKVSANTVTTTTLGYLDATSSIQTQLNNKLSTPFVPYVSAIWTFRGYRAQNNSTTFSQENITALSATGTVTARAIATTNLVTRTVRAAYAVSTPSANAQCGVRVPQALFAVGTGFYFVFSFNVSDSQYNSGALQFYGMTATTTALSISSTVSVSSLLNMIGIGNDAGDTALSIFCNATGTATKITLNATDFPCNRTAGAASTDFFSFELFNDIGSSNVLYRVTNLNTGVVATGTISSNLPTGTTLLAFQAIRTSGSSSNQCSFDFTKIGCYNLT